MRTSESWSIETLTSLADVVSIRDEWNALHERSLDPSPFTSFDWLTNWWRAFAEPSWSMRCLVLRDDASLRAIAPFYVVTERHLLRRARVLRFWQNAHSDRASLLVSADEARATIDGLVAHLVREPVPAWDMAQLDSLVVESATTRMLLDAFEGLGVTYSLRHGRDAPFLKLPGAWEGLDRTLGHSFRKSLRRHMSRAQREGLRWKLHTDADALVRVLEVSADTWQHAAGTGLGSTPTLEAFYLGLARSAASVGSLRIPILYAGEEPIAFELNLDRDRTTYNLKVGYSTRFAHLSPGTVLRYHVLRHAIEAGDEEFDFMGAAERYKLHWTGSTRSHASVLAVHRGTYWNAYRLLRHGLRDLVSRRAPWVISAKRRLLWSHRS